MLCLPTTTPHPALKDIPLLPLNFHHSEHEEDKIPQVDPHSYADFSARLAGINVGEDARIPSGDFGLIGLAVMGQNLILNAADHGFTVVAFNRTVSKVDAFLANEAKGE
jgi:hypothetical protein